VTHYHASPRPGLASPLKLALHDVQQRLAEVLAGSVGTG
jgi:hypothetical protein